MPAFDNTGIVTRNFVKPLSYYAETTTFKERNDEYIKLSLQYSVEAIEAVVERAKRNSIKSQPRESIRNINLILGAKALPLHQHLSSDVDHLREHLANR